MILRSTLTCVLMLFLSNAFSQNVVITGVLRNFDRSKGSLEVRYQEAFLVNKSKILKISADGRFKHEIDCDYPVRVQIGNKAIFVEFYISPKSTIVINGNAATQLSLVKTLKFSGDHSISNRGYFQALNNAELRKRTWRTGENIAAEEVIKKIESYYTLKESLLRKYSRENTIPQNSREFFKLDSISDDYRKASAILNLIDIQRLTKKAATDFFVKHINPAVLTPPDSLKLHVPEVISFWGNSYLSYLVKRDADSIPDFYKNYGYYLSALTKIDTVYEDPVKEYSKASVIYSLLAGPSDFRPGKDSLLSLTEKFVAGTYVPLKSKKQIIESANAIRDKETALKDSINAPPFTAVGLKGSQLSLASYQDSLVFIDVWASWCRPCIAQFPNIDKLMDQYQGKKIVFMMISLDETEKLWESAVTKHKPRPIQFYTSKAFNGDFAKSYFINALPRYIIIRKGEVLQANGLMPDNPDLIKLLDKLLDESDSRNHNQ